MVRVVFFTVLLTGLCIQLNAQPAGAPFQGGTGSGGGTRSAAADRGGSVVRTAALETRNAFITVAGRLEPVRRIDHAIGTAGYVTELFVKPGDRVGVGTALLSVARDAPGESYRPVVLNSRIAGRVSAIMVAPGEEIRSGAIAVTVVDDSSYRIVVSLSDKDASKVAAMGRPAIVGTSAGGMIFKGTLEFVSIEPDYATGLFQAILSFPAQPAFRPGTVLFVDLAVESVRGIFVPRRLVVRRFGRSVLWVLDEAGHLKTVPVETSQSFGDDVLLAGGIRPGDRYLGVLTGYEKEGMTLDELDEAAGKAP